MAAKSRIGISYSASGEPHPKVIGKAFRAADVRISKPRASKKASAAKAPRAYLKLLRVDFASYVKITAEVVPVDDTEGLVFNVWTGGGRGGALHVDTWAEVGPDHPRTGFAALASTRTPWCLWVSRSWDFKRTAMVAIARATGIESPLRVV